MSWIDKVGDNDKAAHTLCPKQTLEDESYSSTVATLAVQFRVDRYITHDYGLGASSVSSSKLAVISPVVD
jgi:hypothetical protein